MSVYLREDRSAVNLVSMFRGAGATRLLVALDERTGVVLTNILKRAFGKKCPYCQARGEAEVTEREEISRGLGYSVAARRNRHMITYEDQYHCRRCRKEWTERKIEESDS